MVQCSDILIRHALRAASRGYQSINRELARRHVINRSDCALAYILDDFGNSCDPNVVMAGVVLHIGPAPARVGSLSIEREIGDIRRYRSAEPSILADGLEFGRGFIGTACCRGYDGRSPGLLPRQSDHC